MAINYREQIAHLCHLQDIDLSLHRLTLELKAFPESLESFEKSYLTLKSDLDSVTSELLELEKRKRLEELEIQSSEAHLKDREAKVYAIKTQKEYQAALKEIADTKAQNRSREDRILQYMERIEELTKKKTQLEPTVADKEKEYRSKATEVELKVEEVTKQRHMIEQERPAILALLEKEVMRKYDFIRKQYPNPVAKVVSGACSACRMHVPAQLYNDMLRFTSVKHCSSCQRILYIEQEQEQKVMS